MKVYAQENLAVCKIGSCEMMATIIISRKVGDISVLFSYCEYHAALAEQYFGGYTDNRKEIKGGFRLA